MQVTTGELTAALARVAPAVQSRATHPVLGGIRFKGLTLAGTDLEVCLISDFHAVGAVDCVVPLKPLAGALAGYHKDDLLSIDVIDGQLIIEGQDGVIVRLVTLCKEDFPEFGAPKPVKLGSIEADALADAFRIGIAAASTDAVRPILTGVLVTSPAPGRLRLVSTDSYRLLVHDIDAPDIRFPEGAEYNLPATSIAMFLKGHPVRRKPAARPKAPEPSAPRLIDLEAADNLCILTSVADGRRTRLLMRTIEGEFPKYRQLVPDHYPNTLELATAELVTNAQRARAVGLGVNTPVKLDLNGHVRLYAVEPGVCEFEKLLAGDYSGEAMTVAFNPQFLETVAKVCGPQIHVEFGSPTKPAVFTPQGATTPTYIQMPVRLSR